MRTSYLNPLGMKTPQESKPGLMTAVRRPFAAIPVPQIAAGWGLKTGEEVGCPCLLWGAAARGLRCGLGLPAPSGSSHMHM